MTRIQVHHLYLLDPMLLAEFPSRYSTTTLLFAWSRHLKGAASDIGTCFSHTFVRVLCRSLARLRLFFREMFKTFRAMVVW